MVAVASDSGSSAAGKPSIKLPSKSARLSVGRNCAPEAMVKTRETRIGMIRLSRPREAKARRPCGQCVFCASAAQRRRDPLPVSFLSRDAKAQPLGRLGEGASEDSCREKAAKHFGRIGLRRQTEEARSAEDAPAAFLQKGV